MRILFLDLSKFYLRIMKKIYSLVFILMFHFGYAQEKMSLSGLVSSEKKGISEARVFLTGTKYATQTDSLGNYNFANIAEGIYKIQIIASGFQTLKKNITVKINENIQVILKYPKILFIKALFYVVLITMK